MLNRGLKTCLPTMGRMLLLLLASLALAGTVNAVSPKGIQWFGREAFSMESKAASQGIILIDLDRMRSIVDQGDWIILDARPESQYRQAHIPGALSVPRGEMAERLSELQSLLTPDQPVLVYCGGKTCDDSLAVAAFLKQQGLQEVGVFEGGMAVWSESGLPVEEGM